MSRFFIDLETETPERFDLSRFMEYTDNHDPLTAAFFDDILAMPLEGYFVVQGEEARPDVIAHKLYGSTQYWWIVMMYNSLTDVNEIQSGISLRYPSLSSVEDAYFSLKSRQTASGE